MPTNENIRRFFTGERVCVLTLTVSTPDDLTEAETAFYTPLADELDRVVEEQLFPLAAKAYRECTDRRKRWRYTPWHASFSLRREGDGVLVLCVCSGDEVHIKEAHTWKDGAIIRKKRLL